MKKKIFNFFKTNNLTETECVNSLIVSAFLHEHDIQISNNQFLIKIVNFDFPNKQIFLEQLLNIIAKEDSQFNFEELIQLFEFVISPNTRIINGAIYTPNNIRSFIIQSLLQRTDIDSLLPTYKIADLSCGCGAFLIDVAKTIKQYTNQSYYEIFQNHIYGIDIENYAIERSKILLILLAITNGEDTNFEFNLLVNNSLTFKWDQYIPNFKGFDLIVGNPPYVTTKHMSDETRQQLANMQTCQIGNPDLYIPFFEIGLENLAENGHLGFITMNSFFKSLNARNLRQYFQKKSVIFKIIDFGAEQIFQSRNTYTCICLISNTNSLNIQYTRASPAELFTKQLNFQTIPYSILHHYHGWNLHANSIISAIENTGLPLGKKYKTSHGLATLKNDLYIFTPDKVSDQFYYLTTKDGQEYKIEKSICVSVINSNKLSRKSTINDLEEKLIFPYTKEIKPKILDENTLQTKFPETYQYFLDHKDLLATRDKGKGKYQTWYAFGRIQGLEQVQHKMFFPKYSDVIPHYLIHSDTQTYFYNGQAFLGNSIRELQILKKILETRLFWFYITATSKPYASNYYSLNGTYIKNFGICNLTEEEENFLLQETNPDILNNFFENKYEIDISLIPEISNIS